MAFLIATALAVPSPQLHSLALRLNQTILINSTLSPDQWTCNFHATVTKSCEETRPWTENPHDIGRYRRTELRIAPIWHQHDFILEPGDPHMNLDIDNGYGGTYWDIHGINSYGLRVMWRGEKITYFMLGLGQCRWSMYADWGDEHCYNGRAGCHLGDWTMGELNCGKRGYQYRTADMDCWMPC
ncbi:hypothetical protein BCR34DRAFT_579468 [Clohesyomyces aquaticus]|uniref:Uncharacterized protein n=1 Tax=Clohesyomyces aquaticus TaxID=1231657 RepID=A0A1Y1YB60_9PLEO|nr:hypothetical protein BCR34DRAFT_579468 [Clohesyomyces aquaticus]